MPSDTRIVHLLGAGGHGRVVADAMLCAEWMAERIVLRDDRRVLAGVPMLQCAVEWPLIPAQAADIWVHGTVGDGRVRQSTLERCGVPDSRWLTVVHPKAVVAASASLGAGSFIAAMAVVAPMAVLGRSVIVNHGAIVDHDVTVGEFSHVAPGAALGGGVSVGRAVLIGSGAVVALGVRIGDGAVIGAGAVVRRDVPSGAVVAGVPAVELKPKR